MANHNHRPRIALADPFAIDAEAVLADLSAANQEERDMEEVESLFACWKAVERVRGLAAYSVGECEGC